jgi:hypothetical protein
MSRTPVDLPKSTKLRPEERWHTGLPLALARRSAAGLTGLCGSTFLVSWAIRLDCGGQVETRPLW